MVDDHDVDITPAAHMIVVRNDDVPGMIGRIGTVVGAAGLNIADMAVGRNSNGVAALQVMSVDRHPSDEVIAELNALAGVVHADRIDL